MPNYTDTIPQPVFYVPYGNKNTVSVYVKDDILGEKNYTANSVEWDFQKTQNRIAIGKVLFYGLTLEDYGILKRGNRVKIFIGNTLFYVYQIQSITFNSTSSALINLEGIECKEKRTYTGRIEYEDTDSATITNALISGVFESGTISSFGKSFFRAEYDRKLRALMNQADYHKSDWWISWNESEQYNVDYYNIASTRGNTSGLIFSTQKDDINCIVSNTANQDNIANYIICLGSGNGETQITSINYHATTNRSKIPINYTNDTWLDEDITATATNIKVKSTAQVLSGTIYKIGSEDIRVTGIPDSTHFNCDRGWNSTTAISHLNGSEMINKSLFWVNDSTLFSVGGGTVWVGSEKITYGASSNTAPGYLLSLTRGVNSTPIYSHAEGIEVWDAQYTTTSPQTGSSIEQNELVQEKYDYRSVIDRNSLDLTAQQILAERKDVLKNVSITPFDLFIPLDYEKVNLGDTVTVIDSASNINETMEIKLIRVAKSMDDQIKCDIQCGKELQLQSVNDLAASRMIVGNFGSYGQGSISLIQKNIAENCDEQTNPDGSLYLRFFIPPETLAIDTLKLSFKIKGFRSYTKTIPAGANYDNEESWGPIDIETNPATFGIIAPYTDIRTVRPGGAFIENHWEGFFWNGNLSSATNITFSIRKGDGTILYQPAGWINMNINPNTMFTFSWDSDIIDRSGGSSTNDDIVFYCQRNSGIISGCSIGLKQRAVSSHTHSVTGDMQVESIPNPFSVVVKVGVDGQETTSVGTYATYTQNDEIDIKSVYNFSPGQWYSIKFTPNNGMRIEADLYGKIFIKT